MNKIIFSLSIILLCFGQNLSAQKLSREYGIITKEDFDYIPDFDENAGAVVLYDICEASYVRNDSWFTLMKVRTKRVKILNEEGLKYANFYIPYHVDGYNRTESVREIEATTYNFENGQKTAHTISKEDIYDETINKFWERKRVAMPQVRVGSVIEITYTIASPFLAHLPNWEFQNDIPTVFSEFTVKMIPFYQFVLLLQTQGYPVKQDQSISKGISRTYRNIDFQDAINTWSMERLPAFRDESFINSRKDNIARVSFQLSKFISPTGGTEEYLTTWEELNDDLNKHDRFGRYIKKSENAAKKIFASELPIEGKSNAEKAQMIIEYVSNSYSWDGFNDKYAYDSKSDLQRDRTGNVGSINLFLVGMLREAGIEANPVIISTRAHGKIWHDYPLKDFFNYVIVYVNDGENAYLADGTERLLPYNRIPSKCINGAGLMLTKEEPLWVDVYSKVNSRDQLILRQEINPETKTASIKSIRNLTEYAAYQEKLNTHDDSTQIADNMLKQGFDAITKVGTRGFDENNKAYTIAVAGTKNLEYFNNQIVVDPFLGFTWTKNPFTEKQRNYPVDFTYQRSYMFQSSIEIPEGYEVIGIPEPEQLNDELMSINFKTISSSNSISFQLSFDLKQMIIAPEYYQSIKADFDKLIGLMNQSLVLAPIGESSK